jgi:hypothetical protein
MPIMHDDRRRRKKCRENTRMLFAVLGAVGAWARVLVELLRH